MYHPFPSHYRAWPCLVWSWQGVWQRTVKPLVAGQSPAESQSTVMDSSRSSCTCHWLSSRLSELGNEKGQAGGSVWVLEVTVEGVWLGCHSYMDCACVKEREQEGSERGLSVSSSWASEQVLYVSQAHAFPTGKTKEVWIHFHSLHWFVFVLYMWGFWLKKTSNGSQVKMSVLSFKPPVSTLKF